MSVYLTLTREFNDGGLRASLSSGQAAVLHRLAVMSKDGGCILRESEDAVAHVLSVLERHGASYRYGTPLDIRWMRGGWSSHLEFRWCRHRSPGGGARCGAARTDACRRAKTAALPRERRRVGCPMAGDGGRVAAPPPGLAHEAVTAQAERVLPFEPPEEPGDAAS